MVHGIWMRGYEMFLLKRRLESAGFPVIRFSYPSLSATTLENAERLQRFLEQRSPAWCLFVCHSYGGLVVCEYLNRFSPGLPTRIVFLGSPVNGSSLARRVGHIRIVRLITGKSLPALKRGCSRGLYGHHCAMIAGSLNIGLGMFFLREEADGLVAVSDTRASWLESHLVVRCSHVGLLFSKKTAGFCADYLRQDLPEPS